jgi:hypothetical protein
MAERRPIEFTLDAKQKVPGLNVVARLNASNKFGEAAAKIVCLACSGCRWSMLHRNSRQHMVLTNCKPVRGRAALSPSCPQR